MASLTNAIELRGRHASLVPLKRQHEAALSKAGRDGGLWQLGYTSVSRPERMHDRELCDTAAGSVTASRWLAMRTHLPYLLGRARC